MASSSLPHFAKHSKPWQEFSKSYLPVFGNSRMGLGDSVMNLRVLFQCLT